MKTRCLGTGGHHVVDRPWLLGMSGMYGRSDERKAFERSIVLEKLASLCLIPAMSTGPGANEKVLVGKAIKDRPRELSRDHEVRCVPGNRGQTRSIRRSLNSFAIVRRKLASFGNRHH